jgi:hypothetical protein
VVKLRPAVVEALGRHGVVVAEGDTPATIRERLNDLYLEEVRQLRARQRAGEIPLAEYSHHAQALQERYPLLGLPLELWIDAPGASER